MTTNGDFTSFFSSSLLEELEESGFGLGGGEDRGGGDPPEESGFGPGGGEDRAGGDA